MKKAKRILAGALAALILTMSLPLSALADEADVPVESPSFEVAFDSKLRAKKTTTVRIR